MQTLTIEQDAETREQLISIQAVLLEIKKELKELKTRPQPQSGWLPASTFCREYGISRPTLKSHVERGLVIAKTFGDERLRYRWTEEEN